MTHVRRLRQARLVGRLAETSVLDEALRTRAEANPVAVVIAGDAGIGKSRLAAEVSAAGPPPKAGRC